MVGDLLPWFEMDVKDYEQQLEKICENIRRIKENGEEDVCLCLIIGKFGNNATLLKICPSCVRPKICSKNCSALSLLQAEPWEGEGLLKNGGEVEWHLKMIQCH